VQPSLLLLHAQRGLRLYAVGKTDAGRRDRNMAKTFVTLGVDKIRLTGGEPLVRKDAAQIIQSLAKLPVTLTLTTNGIRLHHYLQQLTEVGIRSLNISLDTFAG
jgi:molybdenum cofactor biosynthesis enzyme MoaA